MKKHDTEQVKIIAYMAMVIGSTALVPQIIKAVKMQKADEISLTWLLMGLSADILWVVYAFKNSLSAQLIATIIGSIPIIILIILKYTLPDSND